MGWKWNRLIGEHGEGFYYRAPDARYALVPNARGDFYACRITGYNNNTWKQEGLGTFLFAEAAKGACYERARREAAAAPAADVRGLDQTSNQGEEGS